MEEIFRLKAHKYKIKYLNLKKQIELQGGLGPNDDKHLLEIKIQENAREQARIDKIEMENQNKQAQRERREKNYMRNEEEKERKSNEVALLKKQEALLKQQKAEAVMKDRIEKRNIRIKKLNKLEEILKRVEVLTELTELIKNTNLNGFNDNLEILKLEKELLKSSDESTKKKIHDKIKELHDKIKESLDTRNKKINENEEFKKITEEINTEEANHIDELEEAYKKFWSITKFSHSETTGKINTKIEALRRLEKESMELNYRIKKELKLNV
jgi:hypothetical protein